MENSTQPRVFRIVASLVGLQLVTSLVAVAKSLGQSRETAQRQLNAEKKKRKEGPRIESLNKILSEKHEKITMVEEMMRKMFTGSVLHSGLPLQLLVLWNTLINCQRVCDYQGLGCSLSFGSLEFEEFAAIPLLLLQLVSGTVLNQKCFDYVSASVVKPL
jgi:hypothetical protein